MKVSLLPGQWITTFAAHLQKNKPKSWPNSKATESEFLKVGGANAQGKYEPKRT